MRAIAQGCPTGGPLSVRAPRLFCFGQRFKPRAQRLAPHLQSDDYAERHLGEGSAEALRMALTDCRVESIEMIPHALSARHNRERGSRPWFGNLLSLLWAAYERP